MSDETDIPKKNSKEEADSKIIPPPESIPPAEAEEKLTINNIEPTTNENMEVHHHPEIEKKGLKEYLLEGFMIFIAVSMGFIAENIREVYHEHETANTYANEMIQDLQADTAQLHSYIRYSSGAAATIDTFLQLLTTAEINDIPSGKLYWYGLLGAAYRSFRPNDAAFQQMKSSGSLRFLNKSIAQKIAEYDQLCRSIEANEETDRGIYIEVRKLRGQIFEFRYNSMANDIFQANFSTSSYNKQKADSFMNLNPPLLTFNKEIFNQYAELIRARFMNRKVVAADTLLVHATELLNKIKREYEVK